MRIDRVVWDLEDDPRGNVQHIAENGLTPEEVEEVLFTAEEVTHSLTTGAPLVFGITASGKYIAVVFEIVEEVPLAVWPITAFEVDP